MKQKLGVNGTNVEIQAKIFKFKLKNKVDFIIPSELKKVAPLEKK